MINKIIRNFIAKQMAGRSDDGIMITLKDPKKVDLETAKFQELLMRNGIDPRAITSEAQLKTILNQIRAIETQAIRNTDVSGIRGTTSAKIFDLEGKEIPKGSKIMGGKAVDDDLPPPGSRGGDEDIAAPVQSSEETLKNMIVAENKKNIAAMKQRKMLDDAIEDASPGFANDIKYDAEIVAENLAERMGLVYDDLPTKQRLDLYDQAYTGLSKQRFKNKPEPEDMAQGGRAGFANGSEGIMSLDEGAPSILLRPRASGMTREQQIAPGINLSERDINYGISGILQGDKFYGGASLDKGKVKVDVETEDGQTLFKDTIGKDDALNFIVGMGDPKGENDKFQIKFDDDLENMSLILKKSFAEGGRANFDKGGMSRRQFMKIMGGIASLPFIGKYIKPAMPLIKKGAEITAPALDKIIETVMSAGKLISQSGRRVKEMVTKKKLKDVEVEEDIMDGPSYTIKTKDKTIYYRPGRQDEMGIDDDIIEVIEDTVTKKAGGGIARMLGE